MDEEKIREIQEIVSQGIHTYQLHASGTDDTIVPIEIDEFFSDCLWISDAGEPHAWELMLTIVGDEVRLVGWLGDDGKVAFEHTLAKVKQ